MNIAHSLSLKVYRAVFAALMALTLITLGVAFVDLGDNLNVVVALTIAVGKAVLVMLYFMHLRHSHPLTWIVAGAAIFWLMILIVLTLSDVLMRSGPNVAAGYSPATKLISRQAAMSERADWPRDCYNDRWAAEPGQLRPTWHHCRSL